MTVLTAPPARPASRRSGVSHSRWFAQRQGSGFATRLLLTLLALVALVTGALLPRGEAWAATVMGEVSVGAWRAPPGGAVDFSVLNFRETTGLVHLARLRNQDDPARDYGSLSFTVADDGQARERTRIFIPRNAPAGERYVIEVTPQYRDGVDRGSVSSRPFPVDPAGLSTIQGQIAVPAPRVEKGENLWFRATDFTSTAGFDHVALLKRDGDPGRVYASLYFKVRYDDSHQGSADTLETVMTVPDDAPSGSYYLQVHPAIGEDLVNHAFVQSGPIEVTEVTTKVRNPGEHQSGVEDITVSAGGTWTFYATGLTANGGLRAVHGGNLGGYGQREGAPVFPLDAQGRTIGITRILIPDIQPDGPMAITFIDSAGQTLVRTLDVVSDADARYEVVSIDSGSRTMTLRGDGWLVRDRSGGSVIGVKISDPSNTMVLRLADDLTVVPSTGQTVRTRGDPAQVWFVIEADASGHFEVTMPLPSGLTSGPNASQLPFPVNQGPNTLTLLTGQLHPRGTDFDEGRSQVIGGLTF